MSTDRTEFQISTPQEEAEIQVSSSASLEAAEKAIVKGNHSGPIKITFRKGTFTPSLNDKIEGLLKVISTASTDFNIRSVCITDMFLKMFVDPATAERICRAIGKIPSLRVLKLQGLGNESNFKHLALILEEAKQLTTLECERVIFLGTTQDSEDLGVSLHRHRNLEKVSFKFCELERRNLRNPGCVQPILLALRTIPNLKELSLSCWIPTNPMRLEEAVTNAWKDLCCHPNLSHLVLQIKWRNDFYIKPMLEKVATSTSLQSLDLQLERITYTRSRLLLNLLCNNARLQRVSLHLVDSSMGGLGGDSILPILQPLEENSTLLELSINLNDAVTFIPSSHVRDTILSLLESKNCTLSKLNLHLKPDDEGNKQFLWQSEYYLTLNRSGGKNLLKNPDAPPKHWLDALAKCSSNVPALFSLLSANPALCSIHAVKRVEPSESKDTCDHNQRPTKTPRIG